MAPIPKFGVNAVFQNRSTILDSLNSKGVMCSKGSCKSWAPAGTAQSASLGEKRGEKTDGVCGGGGASWARADGRRPKAASRSNRSHPPPSGGALEHLCWCPSIQFRQYAFWQWTDVRCAQGGYCQSQSLQTGSCKIGAVEEAGLGACFPFSLPFAGAFA